MKPLAILTAVILAIVAIPLYLYNPYVNGVAYALQRECERTVLLDIAYELAESRHKLRNGNTAPTFQEIINALPPSTEIEYAGHDFTMIWDIVDRRTFSVGDVNRTVILFPNADLAQITEIHTPLIIHVSSSFTKTNDNCVLMVFLTPEIGILGLHDNELSQLLACESPADAADWYSKYRNRR